MIEMIGDDWSGSKSGEWRETDPDKETIHSAIRSLDGHTKTSLPLVFDDFCCQLTVAGGPTMLVVFGELANDSVIDLTNADAAPDVAPVELVCGGNRATFDASQVVSVDQAIAAVDEFLGNFPNGFGSTWKMG